MPRHTFIRQTKLRNVIGRIDYIQNPKRQEYLYALYDTAPDGFWEILAKQNQIDFRKSGTTGKCIEARELIIALPEVLQEKPPDQLLELTTEAFREKYGVECAAALHHNKRKTNYHIHLIYSERKLMNHVEEKIATRNMFYDETGRHVRTKKEILDVDGNIRSGCYIVPKGMPYEFKGFYPKEQQFKAAGFLDEVKSFYTALINEMVPEEEQLTVFPKSGPFLPTQKIGKNNPKEAEIRESNAARQGWNDAVSSALVKGMPVEELKEAKKKWILAPTFKAKEKYGYRPELFIRIVKRAVTLLVEKARGFRPSLIGTMKRLQKEADRQNQERRSLQQERPTRKTVQR